MNKVWTNGRIYTLVEEGEQVEAVVTQNGKIVATGTKRELLHKWQPAEVMDLEGNVMLPGLVDSHLHLVGHGEKLMTVDLSHCQSYEELLEVMKEAVGNYSEGQWVVGVGWNETLFRDGKQLHLEDFDTFSKNHPLLLKRVCHHCVFVNRKGLELAGIKRDTETPNGGKIGWDEQGEPNGFFYEEAIELVSRALPPKDKTYVKRAMELSIQDCLKNGLVGVHTEDLAYYEDEEDVLAVFEEVVHEGTRFKMNLLVNEKAQKLFTKEWPTSPYIEKGAMKLFADGSLGARTALLSAPYADSPSETGVMVIEGEQLKEYVRFARKQKMAVAIHTIGDLSLEYILDALEAVPAHEGMRDRIIHAELVRDDLLERMKKLSIAVDIQPVFISTGFRWMIDRIGEERVAWAHRWKTMLDAGIPCAGGSDAPIETVNPFVGMYCAVTQRNAFFEKEGVFREEEKLSRYEAMNLYTEGSAFAIGKETCRGKIAVGYEGDFTIIDRDYFTCSEEEILDIVVEKTVVDGEVVYRRIGKVTESMKK